MDYLLIYDPGIVILIPIVESGLKGIQPENRTYGGVLRLQRLQTNTELVLKTAYYFHSFLRDQNIVKHEIK